MKPSKMQHIFYSWQSDSPPETNRNAIRNAARAVCKTINAASPSKKLVLDEATRDTSGSPNIALKILEKIENAEIFIADVTTITPHDVGRPCPNPNVSYELGYAVSELGWDRVILLFNEAIGEFPKDIPFDLLQNRVSRYSFAPNDNKKAKMNDLQKLLRMAIKAIADKNPKRPAELKGISSAEIKHARDLENMRWLMENLHIPTLQQHIMEMPHTLTDQALWFYEGFVGVVNSALFHVYDPVLDTATERLATAWRTALSHDHEYTETPNGTRYVFSSPGDMPLRGQRQRNWDEIDAARKEMAEAIGKILDRVRGDYLEINLHETNSKSWERYVDFQKAL